MNQKTKDSIVEKVVHIASNATDPSHHGIRRSRGIVAEGVAFSLVDDFADEFEALSKRLLQEEGWNEKFSEKYVENALEKLIASILKDGDLLKASEYFDQLVATFENYSQEQIVYVPLVGIQVHGDELPIGQIVLRKMTDAHIDDLTKKIESITMTTRHTPEQKEQFVQSMRQQIFDSLRETVCAEFRIIAEPGRARERAEEETRRILDLLRYSIPALYQEGYNVAVGLQGEISREIRTTPILSSDVDRFNWHRQVVGPLVPLELSPEHIEIMTRLGVFKVSEVLEKPEQELNDFERTLLRGIHWFANSQTEFEIENKFLSLIICLETFLTPRDGNPIGTAIAEGVAILITTGLENRKRLKKRIKKLYQMRSAVSHGGYKAIFDTDLAELRAIAGTLTKLMIDQKDEFPTQKALLEWIEDQKLG